MLRLPLRTYSIGHQLLLTRIRSPFAVECDRKPTLEDLMYAVLLCSDSFEAGARIHEDVFARAKLWLWRRRIRGIDSSFEIAKFSNYVALGSLGPRVKPSGEGRPPGSPWILRLKNFVQFELRKTESEAWNYPYGRAQIEFAAYWEEKGGLKVYNANELAFMAECERLEAEHIAEEKAKAAAAAATTPGPEVKPNA